MIYTTGTIAGNGSTITGTGTNFTAAGSLIRVGCTLIAFTNPVQVLQLTAVTSANALSVTPAISPAITAGTKYAILLSDSLSVDGLAQDIAETFGMYQKYMGGFADVMNGTGDVTITINGLQVAVPGQKSLAKKGANSDITSLSGLTTALSVDQGGTGGKTKQSARDGIGLGDIAVKNTTDFIATGGQGAPADSYRFFRTDHTVQNNVNINNVSDPGVYPGLINFANATNPPAAGGYGYIANYGRINKGNADWSMCQLSLPHSLGGDSGRMFYRGCNASIWGAWKEITTSAVSDATAKNIGEDLDPEEALSNISRMEFKHFTFKDDESETPRRGVISQQIETIDPEYVKKIGELLHLDQTPMMLDGLAAIKALKARSDYLEERVSALEAIVKNLHNA
ncbi:pyocin knob domain-containing S74 family peptidase [Buttiauxella gaviniae]|uniref:pyocin knob domain-containing S74 family peptidase n=1 Tax=Buttiauxella gaviniae TaxID=82990 RepID=UPI003974AC48